MWKFYYNPLTFHPLYIKCSYNVSEYLHYFHNCYFCGCIATKILPWISWNGLSKFQPTRDRPYATSIWLQKISNMLIEKCYGADMSRQFALEYREKFMWLSAQCKMWGSSWVQSSAEKKQLNSNFLLLCVIFGLNKKFF